VCRRSTRPRALREQAELLDALVARFVVDDDDAPERGNAALRAPSSRSLALMS
jgi:hypothetical protein